MSKMKQAREEGVRPHLFFTIEQAWKWGPDHGYAREARKKAREAELKAQNAAKMRLMASQPIDDAELDAVRRDWERDVLEAHDNDIRAKLRNAPVAPRSK